MFARYDARSSDKWTFNEPRERRIIRFIKQVLPRPEQASLILTEVDLPVAARLTLAEETFRGMSCSLDRLQSTFAEHWIGSNLFGFDEREGEGRGGGREREEVKKIQVAPTDQSVTLINSLRAQLLESSRGVSGTIPALSCMVTSAAWERLRNNTMGPRWHASLRIKASWQSTQVFDIFRPRWYRHCACRFEGHDYPLTATTEPPKDSSCNFIVATAALPLFLKFSI